MASEWIEGEIDGVHIVVHPSDGPLTLGLTFRVGVVDETVITRGVTRIALHTVAARAARRRVSVRPEVGAGTSSIVLSGPPEDVLASLTSMLDALGEPSATHLERVRSELVATRRNHLPGQVDRQLRWRFGNRGWGLAAHGEHGLESTDADTVDGWIRRYFAAGNAALWAVGPLPGSLRLPLPMGSYQPLPRAVGGPAERIVQVGGDLVVLTLVLPAGPHVAVAAAVLGRGCRHRLERLGAMVEHGFVALDDERSLVVVGVDPMEADPAVVIDEVLSQLGVLAVAGPERVELRAAVDELRQDLADVDPRSAVSGAAIDRLVQRRLLRPAEVVAAWHRITTTAHRDLFAQAQATACLAVPDGFAPTDGRYRPLDRIVATPVAGAVRVEPSDRVTAGDRLQVGAVGVIAFEAVTNTSASVSWPDCVAVLTEPDGTRIVVGSDHTVIPCRPAEWKGGADLVAAIDRYSDPEISVARAG